MGMRPLLYVLAAVLLVSGLVVAGCEGEDPDGEGAVTTATEAGDQETSTAGAEEETTTTPAEEEATTTSEPDVGTRQNPLPLKETAVIGDWEITVNEVALNANDVVAETNQFNDPPAEGNQYVMPNITATYMGEESGTFWLDMSYRFYGSDGNTFDSSSVVIPNQLSDAGETFPGASVTGNLVFEVPSGQVEGGAIIIENSMSMDPDRVFFAIQ